MQDLQCQEAWKQQEAFGNFHGNEMRAHLAFGRVFLYEWVPVTDMHSTAVLPEAKALSIFSD